MLILNRSAGWSFVQEPVRSRRQYRGYCQVGTRRYCLKFNRFRKSAPSGRLIRKPLLNEEPRRPVTGSRSCAHAGTPTELLQYEYEGLQYAGLSS